MITTAVGALLGSAGMFVFTGAVHSVNQPVGGLAVVVVIGSSLLLSLLIAIPQMMVLSIWQRAAGSFPFWLVPASSVVLAGIGMLLLTLATPGGSAMMVGMTWLACAIGLTVSSLVALAAGVARPLARGEY